MRYSTIVFLLLAVLPLSMHALDFSAAGAALPIGMDPALASFMQRLDSETSVLNLSADPAEQAAFFRQHALLVTGSNIDAPERAALEAAKAAYPQLNNATPVPDSAESAAKMRSGKYLVVILIGGPSQNSLTKEALANGWLNGSNSTYAGFLVNYGKSDSGTLMVSFSDQRGYGNAARESVKYSPLSAFIPAAYIPIAATGISALLLAIFSIVRTVFEFKALDVGRKGRKVGESRFMLGGVNLMEPLAIMGASLVLGISMSWQFFGPSPDFAWWVAVNTFICLCAAILHEVSHRLVAHVFGFRVEYRIWPAGSLLTLVSSWLGNAFSVQGFLLEEIPENAVKWKVALMRIVGPLVSSATMVAFALLNAVFPSVYFQLIFSTSALWAVAEVFPFSGLDGKDLKDWNILVWLFTFLMVGGAYVLVTFIL